MTRQPWREVAAGYDAGAIGYDARHDGRRDRAHARRIERPMLDAAQGATRVLELGVGTGRVLAQVAAPVRIGVDVAARMLDVAAGKGLAVVRADAHRLPFAARSFDAVLAGGGVFRYLDAATALAEVARVLVGGGILAIHQFGARTWGLRGARRPDPRVRELDRVEDLTGTATAVGFAVERVVRWRTIRLPPFLVEIPPWLDRHSSIQLWSQVVVVMRGA